MSGTEANVRKSEPSTTRDLSLVPGVNLYTDFASDSIPTHVQPVQAAMMSEPKQTTKETQGKVDGTSEGHLKKPNRKDWIDTENPLHCKPCNFVAQSIEEFQDHSLSYRHIKKTAEVLEMRVNPKKDEEKKKHTSFTCEICACSCNSESAWNSHLVGQKHRKNLEKLGAAKMFQKHKMKHGMEAGGGPVFHKNPPSHGYKPYQKLPYIPHSSYSSLPNPGIQCANDFAQYKEPLIGLEYVTEIQVTGQNPRYHCKLCDAKFDHNVKFPHLVGAKHRFNVLKEKNPAVAQEIRLGVKKRSELTGKLLEEATKIEQHEGRQQVKTCVEASPFDGDTRELVQGSSLFEESSPYPGNAVGLGRGFAAPSRPYQKSLRGHPLKGPVSHSNRPGQKRSPVKINYQNQFEFTPSYVNNIHQPHNSSVNSFGEKPPTYQGTPMRGRGGRGRGFRMGTNQVFGRGCSHQQNRLGPGVTSTSTYQQNNHGFYTSTPHNRSTIGPLLPSEAFAPMSSPRPPSNKFNSRNNFTTGSGSSQNAHPDQTGTTQTFKKNDSPAIIAQSSSEPETPTTESTQDLLRGLTDLGKLVSTEEDASIALQVSNALTQALLKYRMQNIKEDQK